MGEAVKKIRQNRATVSAEEFEAFAENSPINIMYCDLDLNVKYVNPQSLTTLAKLSHVLPIPVDKILGSNIDVFHKNPAHQRGMLADPRNFPHRTTIEVGDEKLDLFVTAVIDKAGKHQGAMVCWDIVTKQLKAADEMARINNMMHNMPTNVMYCDRDLTVQYMNPKSEETLRTIQQYLPIPIDKIVGSSIDVFHKNPSHQRTLLGDDRNLPHNVVIEIGPEKLDLLASAIYNDQNEFVGTMITWDIVTKKLENENAMARMKAMVENTPVNIMMADLDFNLVYMNPASSATLRKIEQNLPVSVDKIIGQKIDIFHKDPQGVRNVLSNHRNLPHKVNIKVGPDTLALLAAAMFDNDGEFIGPMVTWSLISDRVKLVDELTEASTQLAAAAAQLNASATQMASNAEETAGQVGEASASSEEVAKGVEVMATNTEEMQASIKEIARNANEASSMSNGTKGQAQSTNNVIKQLGDSSQEIGNVIKVISSIAQQTNLLALNATIEAARAGDAGRGFAVVANEVKELAKQTATATEEITRKIGAIQDDSENAVSAIGDIGVSIDKLNDIAGSIAASVEEQMATTNEFARVVQESNTGVQGIADNIKSVGSASGQTAQGANQVLDAARGLQTLAEKLSELVSDIEV